MKKDAFIITAVISCDPAEKLPEVERLARDEVALDRTVTHVARSFPNGVEMAIERHYRLRDYFDEIQFISEEPASFKLVFHPKTTADRYWKDLMAGILSSIRDSTAGVAVKSVKKSV